MACPFFIPVQAAPISGWKVVPRMPLGRIYSGACSAQGDGPEEDLSEENLQQFCNSGYARGKCRRFPADAPADAVRFSICGDSDGRIQLTYIFERNHSPIEYGPLEFTSILSGAEGRSLLEAQAQAFVESYKAARSADGQKP